MKNEESLCLLTDMLKEGITQIRNAAASPENSISYETKLLTKYGECIAHFPKNK